MADKFDILQASDYNVRAQIKTHLEYLNNTSTGDYVPGAVYGKGQEVFDGSNLSEAKIDGVTSSPFVSPVGTPEYLYDGTGMRNTPQLASQVIFGNRYTNPDEPLYITGYRVNVVSGNFYSIVTVSDPLGAKILNELAQFTSDRTGWVTLSIEPVPIPTGDIFDLFCVVREPDPTPVIVTAPYNYLTPQNAVDPIAGEIQHGRSQMDQMRISYTDDNTVDRTALIQGLSIGDQISDGIIDWAVQSNSDQGTFAIIGVTPATVSTAGAKNFDFQTVTPTPIAIPSDPAYWATSPFPFIQGLVGVDVAYDDITTNTNAYGIDILGQPAYIPDPSEWHLKIIASGGSDSSSPSKRIKSEVVARAASYVDQDPPGLGLAQQVALEDVQVVSDAFTIDASGLATCLIADEYTIKIKLAIGRTGSSGESQIYTRALLNGTPIGDPTHTIVDNARIEIPQFVDNQIEMAVGDTIALEFIRDSDGTNSGGLRAGNPDVAGWSDSPSAKLTIVRNYLG